MRTLARLCVCVRVRVCVCVCVWIYGRRCLIYYLMHFVVQRTGWTGSMAQRHLNLVLADSNVWNVGEDGRLARRSVGIQLQNLVEVFRSRRLVLVDLRHEANPWTKPRLYTTRMHALGGADVTTEKFHETVSRKFTSRSFNVRHLCLTLYRCLSWFYPLHVLSGFISFNFGPLQVPTRLVVPCWVTVACSHRVITNKWMN